MCAGEKKRFRELLLLQTNSSYCKMNAVKLIRGDDVCICSCRSPTKKLLTTTINTSTSNHRLLNNTTFYSYAIGIG